MAGAYVEKNRVADGIQLEGFELFKGAYMFQLMLAMVLSLQMLTEECFLSRDGAE